MSVQSITVTGILRPLEELPPTQGFVSAFRAARDAETDKERDLAILSNPTLSILHGQYARRTELRKYTEAQLTNGIHDNQFIIVSPDDETPNVVVRPFSAGDNGSFFGNRGEEVSVTAFPSSEKEIDGEPYIHGDVDSVMLTDTEKFHQRPSMFLTSHAIGQDLQRTEAAAVLET